VEAVVVLVAQKPHEDAGCVPVLLNKADDLGRDGLAEVGVGVVHRGDPRAIERESVTPDQVVEHRRDAVVLVDVLDPAGRDANELPDGVDAHVL